MRRADAFAVTVCAALVLLQTMEPVKAEGKYTIVGPGTIHSHRDYNVAVAVHQTNEPVTIKIGITGPSYNETQTVELAKSDEFQQLSFQLPPLESGDYNLTAEGVKGIEFKNSTKLNYENFKPYIKIQTDKGKYKPGDTINYRVIFLNENLLPDTAADEVVVWFEDSKRNRIKQEKHIKTTGGVYTGKFELSEFATLGSWSLQVQNGEQSSSSSGIIPRPFFGGLGHWRRFDERVNFEVEKYVLPKYSVKLDATQQVSVRDGEMNVVLKANYTYGKPVNGKVLVNVNLDETSIWENVDGKTVRKDLPGHSVIGTADMVNGKAKLSLDLKEFASYLRHKTSASYAQITATVEEDFTGVKLNETGGVQLYPYRYEMSCVDYSTCFSFKPDKEYEITFKITLVDGSLLTDTKSVVKAKFKEGIRRTYGWYHYGSEEKQPELPEIKESVHVFETHLNESSLANFKVNLPDLPDMENFTRYYSIELEYADEKRELFTTYPYREPKKLDKNEEEEEKEKEWFKAEVQKPKDTWSLKIGQEYQVTLNSSRPLNYFVYNIVGRGNILETKRVQLTEPQTVYNVTFKPTFLTAPHGRIYFYYVDETGEFRHAEESFSVEVELQNSIEIKAPEEVKPGADVELEIKTPAKSFVGLMAVDQSVLLLGNNNDVTKDSFNWRLNGYDTSTPWQGGYSYYPGERSGVVTMTNAYFFYNRTAPVAYPQAAGFAGASFAMRKTAVMQDSAHLSTTAALGAAAPEAVGFSAVSAPATPTVRKNFAETWIFADIESTEADVFKWVKTIPDTITNWVVTGFSLHPQKGLGVTDDKVNVRTFQPFFVSVRLPYSVKRGEVISVPALVFNYLPKTLDVELTLNNDDGEYDFVDASNEVIGDQKRSQNIRVGANEAAGANFLIRPKAIGNILLKFSAISPLAGDAVHRSLKVIPEGITKYQNRAFFINLKDTGEFKTNFELEVPEDIVPDSERVEFGLVGDLLGPVVKNLENLLRLPSGCGEQTMSKLVPNYLVRGYLQTIKKLTPALDSRIKRNLQEGYQNMLHYRHDDGSFSSFGPRKWLPEEPERNGSTWLTAYVLRYFSQMQDIVDVDEQILAKGYEFLLARQNENGSFTEKGEYFYDSQRSLLTLTAKSLLALLQAEKPESHQEAIDKAVSFLSANTAKSEEILPKAIAVYALQKAKATGAAKFVAELQSLAQKEDDRTWWTEDVEKLRASGGCRRWWCWVWSNDVEITSYALLSILDSSEGSPDTVLNIIRWLVAQRNSFGGFASSQDTVVGLTALIRFAEKTGYEAAKWEVTVANKGKREKTEKLTTSEENDLLLQTVEFPQGTKSLDFEAKGTGAALVQVSYQYNVVEKEPKPSFKVETIVRPETTPAKLELTVCVDFVEEGKAKASNMAILEVSLPSGYTADEESFQEIREIERVRLVETKNGDSVVVIYFENLAKNQTKCIPIEAFKTHAVANQKPSSVVLYDYYDTNKKATEYYSIDSKLCDICDNAECKSKC
ncbi:hypothetical protein KR018_011420 [Drosophila ironensis]|nr:hypothetical protein KR018_011420 [Drosophila ironensis]